MSQRIGLGRIDHLVLSSLRIVLISLFALVLQLHPPQTSATDAPEIDNAILAVIHGRPYLNQPLSEALVITGQNFGNPDPRSDSYRLEFTFGGSSLSLSSTDEEAIPVWEEDSEGHSQIHVFVPQEVRTGQLRVIADKQPSAPIDFLVYQYDSFDIPAQPGTNAHGLALAVAADGRIWMNREFHRYLQVFDPTDSQFDSFPDSSPIPQAEGDGIFASTVFGDHRSITSGYGEDVEIDSYGNIWFTQGGAGYYPGIGEVGCPRGCEDDPEVECVECQFYNTSRVIKYTPATGEFSCFNSPLDNAIVSGVLVDKERGMIWYTEGKNRREGETADDAGNAIVGIKMTSTLSNCYFDPYCDDPDPGQCPPRDSFCTNGPADDCHWRFPLPPQGNQPSHLELDENGNIWFTKFWGGGDFETGEVLAAVGRLTPETGEIIQLPFPVPINPVLANGTWELRFDQAGDLWVTEFSDATISRITTDPDDIYSCTQLEDGKNPCVEEVFVGQNQIKDASIHTLDIAPDDGKVWFAVSQDAQGFPNFRGGDEILTVGQIGFIDPAHNDEDVILPILRSQYHPQDGPAEILVNGIGDTAGVAVHPQSGDIYFIEYNEKQLGRLRLFVDTDDDGIPDETDNCPLVYNPDQLNTDSACIANGPDIGGECRANPNKDAQGDACDQDDDNDWMLDTGAHPTLGIPGEDIGCGSGPTDPEKQDTDGDTVVDGAECLLGYDPKDPDSKPQGYPPGDNDLDGLPASIEALFGTSDSDTDSDDDGIGDGVEVKGWATSPTDTDTDGDSSGNDGCQDDKQIVDVNGNGQANILDVMSVASICLDPGPWDPVSEAVADINRDGANNILDVQLAVLNSTLVEAHDPCQCQ